MSVQLGSALADAALAADEKVRPQGVAVGAAAICSDHTSYAADVQKCTSLDKSDPSTASHGPTIEPEDCEAQLRPPLSKNLRHNLELIPDDNDPHSPARLSEWETSLIVIGFGALVSICWLNSTIFRAELI